MSELKEVAVAVSATPVSLGIVDRGCNGMTIYCRLVGDLDSGTITIGFRAPNSSGVVEILDATLVLGTGITVTTGAGAEIFATASGTTPDLNLLVGQYS